MAHVLNRTTKEYIRSAHTPDYPVEDWIHKPDLSAVMTSPEVPVKYWKITGDVISEMSQAEKDAYDVANPGPVTYEIQDDVTSSLNSKDITAINYKTELKSGVAYTPEFVIHDSGVNAGLLSVTNYYRDYVDEDNKGTLVLIVEETYVVDESDPSQPNSAKSALSRTKTWKHAKKGAATGSPPTTIDNENNKKIKPKLYNTRQKQHVEGIRRRNNILEQAIDNVSLAGILTGAFSGVPDAYEKMTAFLQVHNSAFEGWKTSGIGSLYDDILVCCGSPETHDWLDVTVQDDGTTQAMIPWMIGLDLRSYLIDKLKGNIK